MVRTVEEILEILKTRFGDDDSDETISILEDVSDTITEAQKGDGEDWKTKYEENDKAWRQKYKDRFASKETKVEKETEEVADTDGEDKVLQKFEDLFKEG